MDKTRDSASSTIPTEVYYRYDAFGRRAGHYYKWNDVPSLAADSEFHSKELVYDGVMLVEEWYADSAPASLKNKLKRRYYYEEGINKLALVENYNGQELPQTSYVPITDDRGTLMGVVNAATGQLVEKLYYNSTGLCKAYHYDAGTGNYVESLWPDTTYNIGRSQYIPFGWCGMYRDPFTGKYHTHYRDYDPVHGRWLSEDPAGYADGLNLYNAYMGVNGVDPLGLMGTCGMCADWAGNSWCPPVCPFCGTKFSNGQIAQAMQPEISDLWNKDGLTPAQIDRVNNAARNTGEMILIFTPVPKVGLLKNVASAIEKSFVLRNAAMGAKIAASHEITAPIAGDSMNLGRGAQNFAMYSTGGMALEGICFVASKVKSGISPQNLTEYNPFEAQAIYVGQDIGPTGLALGDISGMIHSQSLLSSDINLYISTVTSIFRPLSCFWPFFCVFFVSVELKALSSRWRTRLN